MVTGRFKQCCIVFVRVTAMSNKRDASEIYITKAVMVFVCVVIMIV